MADDKDKIMGVEGLAKYLDLSKSTVYKLAQEGALPGQKVGKHWRFRQETVNRWLDEERPPSKFAVSSEEGGTSEDEKLPENQSGAEASSPGALSLSDEFSPEQIERLKERWIETVDQVLAIAATQLGSSGLQNLLEMSAEELAEKLKHLRGARGTSASLGPAEPGGELGVILEDIPRKAERENGEE